MKRAIIVIVFVLLIIWQWSRVDFYLFEYTTIDTEGVTINGKPWRKYVNSTHFTVGEGNLASDRVEKEIKKIVADPINLYQLKQEGPTRHGTSDISALIVMEAISLASEKSGFMDKPFF